MNKIGVVLVVLVGLQLGYSQKISRLCKKNETLSDCVSPRTCNTPELECGTPCNKGCDCLPGYIREFEGGRCILEQECVCNDQREYRTTTTCNICCEGTWNYMNFANCEASCRPGCQCLYGTYYDRQSKQCVDYNSCPNINQTYVN